MWCDEICDKYFLAEVKYLEIILTVDIFQDSSTSKKYYKEKRERIRRERDRKSYWLLTCQKVDADVVRVNDDMIWQQLISSLLPYKSEL